VFKTKVKIVKTRFSDKLVLDLDGSVSVFIPDRVKKAFEETEGLFENFSNAVDKKWIAVKIFRENNYSMEFIVDESCDISLDLYEVNVKGTSPKHKRVALSKLQPEHWYAVSGVKQILTRYGLKVLFELVEDNRSVFAPQRMSSTFEKDQESLNEMMVAAEKGGLEMMHLGDT